MGGNALKVAPTERLMARDYHALARDLTASLVREFGGRAQAIPAYRSKQDFGDLDVLVEAEMATIEELEAFAKAFGHARQVEVGSKTVYLQGVSLPPPQPNRGPNKNEGRQVLSYDHRSHPDQQVGFQVDLIQAPADEFDISLAYFSYNDLGNLIGRIAHKMGFSYGHRGLMLPLREGTHLLGKVLVSSHVDECLAFLGYDPHRFHEGFGNLEDVFAYACSTPYFHPDIFLLENRNHAGRTRDRKRPTYQKFLQHLKGLPPATYFQFPEDSGKWLARAHHHFPDLKEKMEHVFKERDRLERVKEHFNGRLVSQWTGLSGKDLGDFLSRFSLGAGGPEGILRMMEEGGASQVRREVMAALDAQRAGARPKAGRP